MSKRKNRLTCGDILGFKGSASVSDARTRMAERDARLAADNRAEVQKYLGDPAPGRSALTQGRYSTPAPRSHAGTRTDLWKR
jgi:hypothetical protein